jgi:hypothetical protein
MTQKLNADLERDERRGTRDEGRNEVGGRGSCRAETAATGDLRLATGG